MLTQLGKANYDIQIGSQLRSFNNNISQINVIYYVTFLCGYFRLFLEKKSVSLKYSYLF